MKESKIRRCSLVLLLATLSLASCGENSNPSSPSVPAASEVVSNHPSNTPSVTPSVPGKPSETPTVKPSETPSATPSESDSVSRPSVDGITDTIYSVSERLEFAAKTGEAPSQEYVTYGIIKSISNYSYGERTIKDTEDETKELYVYGVRGADGSTYFNDLDPRPQVGDTVYLKASVHTFNGTPELGYKSNPAKLLHLDSTHESVDDTGYSASTIKEAREASVGSKVKVSGVVASITKGQKYAISGLYLIDKTGSIYIYGADVAAQVEVGNTVTIIGEVEHFIATNETTYADKFGYQGAIQLSSPKLRTNDHKTSEFPKDAIQDTTRKSIVETDVKDKNITGNVYHAKAVINKKVGAGFTNYYIDDLDQATGSYVYSRNNGNDFTWLDTYDGIVSDVYFGVTNCKSTNTGCIYRLQPISVSPIENYSRPDNEVTDFVKDYYVDGQFSPIYAGNPNKEVITSHSDSFLGFENVAISYSSNNTEFASFTTGEDGKTIFSIHENAKVNKATITATITYKSYSSTYTMDVQYQEATQGALTVKDARNAKDDTTVKVRGIISAAVLNKKGFYIADSNGIIACLFTTSSFERHTGDEVVIEGKKNHITKDTATNIGQANLSDCVIKGVISTGNTVPRPNIISDKTFDEIQATSRTTDYSRQLYTCSVYYLNDGKNKATISANEADSTASGKSRTIYKGSYNQVAFRKDFENQQVTRTFALTDWNSKTYLAVCPISVTNGTNTAFNNFSFTL